MHDKKEIDLISKCMLEDKMIKEHSDILARFVRCSVMIEEEMKCIS